MPRLLFTTPDRAGLSIPEPLIAIAIGEPGFRPVPIRIADTALLNPPGTTEAILDAAVIGAGKHGWDCPAAQPALDFDYELSQRPGLMLPPPESLMACHPLHGQGAA